MEYKERIAAFRESCRVYLREKEIAAGLDENSDQIFARFLHEDIQFVEETFEKIRKVCGADAENIIRKLFVDSRTQTEVAFEYGLSRRQLQYSLYEWLHRVFENS